MYQKVFLSICAINYCFGQSFNSPPLDWIQTDGTGAYRYGYATGDEGRHYHISSASADNTVAGRFGYKDPATGGDLQTTYTAGRRGFRARGPHIARRMDLSQNKPPFSRPNNDGQYHPELDNIFDPNEDRGYDFSYRTPDHIKEEHANRVGDVQGRYSYLDDIGFRHNVDYIAGSKTGFVVTNPVPDTFAQARGGPLYYVGKTGGSKVRGFSAIQKQLNGAYRFLASGPDHKRSEISDASGNRRGVYTYLDDKGVQHTVEYIAGPKIGYKVINNKKGVNYNPVLPFFPDSSTIQPLFPSSVGGDSGGSGGGGGGSLLGPFPTVPSSPASSSDGSKFPSLSPSGGGGGGGGGKFPSISPAGGPIYPASPSSGVSPSPSLPPSISSGTSKPPSGRPPAGLKPSTFRPPSLFEPAPGKPPSLLEPSSSLPPPFSFEGPDDFPSISPSFPPTTPFPIPSRPQKPSDFDISGQKWNFDFDYFFNDPSNANKDWSVKPVKGDADKNFKGSSHSTPKPPLVVPPFDPFDEFPPSPFPDPSFLPPESFDEGLNTAETNAGFKPGFGDEKKEKEECNNTRTSDSQNKGEGFNEGGRRNDSQTGSRHPFHPDSGYKNTKESGAKHYYKGHKSLSYPSRGTVKFGGVKKNEWHKGKNEEGYFAIPPGVAVRAHVQSLDIVPYNKRFISPGEALEHHQTADAEKKRLEED